MPWRICRYYDGDCPSVRSVAHHALLSAAITAAGLLPRRRTSQHIDRRDERAANRHIGSACSLPAQARGERPRVTPAGPRTRVRDIGIHRDPLALHAALIDLAAAAIAWAEAPQVSRSDAERNRASRAPRTSPGPIDHDPSRPSLGRFWVPPHRPRGTIGSAMTSIHRTSRTPGTPMRRLAFDGKEGVVGSSPTEGFIGTPCYGGDFFSEVGSRDREAWTSGRFWGVWSRDCGPSARISTMGGGSRGLWATKGLPRCRASVERPSTISSRQLSSRRLRWPSNPRIGCGCPAAGPRWHPD
jgi:hypothetical protein